MSQPLSSVIHGVFSPTVDSPPNLLSAQLYLLLCTVDGAPVLHFVIKLPTKLAGPFPLFIFHSQYFCLGLIDVHMSRQ